MSPTQDTREIPVTEANGSPTQNPPVKAVVMSDALSMTRHWWISRSGKKALYANAKSTP